MIVFQCLGESSESSVSAMKMVEDGQNEPKITPKLRRSQEVGEVEEVDRVSELPDCLLIEILSRLPSTKESIRTGTLSKRWKHLWTLVPTLVFTQLDYLSWSSQSFDFYSFVDKALTQRPQSKLKKLEVDANYHTEFESQVKNWIRYAIRCNVEELILKLDLWGTGSFCQLDQFFYISSCFTDLTLDGCILNPTGAISWKNLRSLCITGGKLDEAVIENILSGCPLLETLVLEDCFGYKRLDITSKSVKNLVFSGYRNPYLEWEFAVSAPNISSLTIQDELCLWKLLLLNVNSLIEAKLDYWYDDCMYEEEEEELLKGFIVNLRHVKELKIGVTCSKVLSRLVAKGFHLPSNIKFLDGESESESESESDEDS